MREIRRSEREGGGCVRSTTSRVERDHERKRRRD